MDIGVDDEVASEKPGQSGKRRGSRAESGNKSA